MVTLVGLQRRLRHLILDVGAWCAVVPHGLDTDSNRQRHVHPVSAVHHQRKIHVLPILWFFHLMSEVYCENLTPFDLLTETLQRLPEASAVRRWRSYFVDVELHEELHT